MATIETLAPGPRPLAPAGGGCCTPIEPALGGEAAAAAAERIGLLAHPIRLQILATLAQHAGHVCVCDLEAALPIKQPTVSHHLRLLREAGLVAGERRGQWVYYAVDRPALAALRAEVGALFALIDG